MSDAVEMRDADLPEKATELLYQQAADNLKQQRASLDEMRTRTAALLSASAISNAFLGAAASRGTGVFHLPPRFWIALAPFGVSVALCIAVLLYSSKWKFHLIPSAVKKTISPSASPQEIHIALAGELESMFNENQQRIRLRSAIFTIAAVTTVLAIGAWMWLIE
jgi:hypothetical protein